MHFLIYKTCFDTVKSHYWRSHLNVETCFINWEMSLTSNSFQSNSKRYRYFANVNLIKWNREHVSSWWSISSECSYIAVFLLHKSCVVYDEQAVQSFSSSGDNSWDSLKMDSYKAPRIADLLVTSMSSGSRRIWGGIFQNRHWGLHWFWELNCWLGL